jgi:phage-related protein
MIQNAKYFTFNNRSLSEFDGLRIGNESNDMYSVQIISNRRLIEEKIPGRKAPYFYNIDDDPLTLQITVALEKPKLVSELRPVFQ